MTTESFGELLRRGRERKGLTQVEFARAMGASQSSASRWERGDVPPVSVLSKIAILLDIPFETLQAYERPGAPTLSDRVSQAEDAVRQLAELAEMVMAELEELRKLARKL